MFKIVQKRFDIIFKQCFAIISSFIVKYNSKTGWPGNIFISGDAIHSSYLQSYGCTACGFQCKLWNIRRLSLDHTLFNWKIIPYCLRWPYSNWWNWQIKSTESSGRKLYTVGTDEHSPIKLQSYVTLNIWATHHKFHEHGCAVPQSPDKTLHTICPHSKIYWIVLRIYHFENYYW